MASIIQKTKTLISANLHEMVDRALQSSSPAVMKQYIRDAQKNLRELEDATATVGGEVRTLKRKYEQYKKEADKYDRSVDLLLMQGKAEMARAAQKKVNRSRELQEQYHAQWVSQEREYKTLRAARLKLIAKLDDVKAEQRELEALLKLAKSKEKTVKTIRSIDDLLGVGDADIERLGNSIRARIDKADAQAEMYSSRLDNQMDEVLGTAELDLQLEERKRRLGLGAPEKSADDITDEELLAELDSLDL
ncbi:MAG: PspA/IM30 family protein [Candidatus Promineifilaceae bacterium]